VKQTMKTRTLEPRLIETDEFPFEFLSQLAERESWRKEIHRPVYHVHKWWAKRLGSIFRGILLGAALPIDSDLCQEFYGSHSLTGVSVLDPFMGSGTTVGEAHKLGMTALGRDINPVAVSAVRTALGPLDRRDILAAFERLSEGVGQRLRALYHSKDALGRPCDVLYYFWVMQAECPKCACRVDLFSSHIIARNAYPDRKPEVQIRCPACGDIFHGANCRDAVVCRKCSHSFDPSVGPASGAKASCPQCAARFTILDAIGQERPTFRPIAKLVHSAEGRKEYLSVTAEDQAAYEECSRVLRDELQHGRIRLPELRLAHGHNTRQAMSYNFRSWIDFFNDRQLLALGWLRTAIDSIEDAPARNALKTLFSGALEFNNLFASYKGEGTGAVRHMFSHHILKPERTPIEANVWGTRKSSGAFSNLFRGRLLRAIDYRDAPTEVNGRSLPGRVCSPPFSGRIETEWPTSGSFTPRSIYLSQGDSAVTGLPNNCIDAVVTDPPFFDNVHYSELADFFFAWQQLDRGADTAQSASTRSDGEVQDADADSFAMKLRSVFAECHRVLKNEGLFVFTYHHSRNEGWSSLAEAIFGAGFVVVNSQPVKAEMSVATPKAQAKEPIQLDIIVVCRKRSATNGSNRDSVPSALSAGRAKIRRLHDAGFTLSRNDRKVVLYGQLLTAIANPADLSTLRPLVEDELLTIYETKPSARVESAQPVLFGEV
jgi:putative DNA methylase